MTVSSTARYVGQISNSEPSKLLNIAWRDSDIADLPPDAPAQLAVAIEEAAGVRDPLPFAALPPAFTAFRCPSISFRCPFAALRCPFAALPPALPPALSPAVGACKVAFGVEEQQVKLQEEFGKKIGEDLFTFMESFNHVRPPPKTHHLGTHTHNTLFGHQLRAAFSGRAP